MIPVVVSNNRIPSILTGENLILPSLKFLPNNVKLKNGSVIRHRGTEDCFLRRSYSTVVTNASEKYYKTFY